MKKINYVAVGNLVGLLCSGAILIKYFYILAIVPFIKDEITALTGFGVLISILAMIVFTETLEYTINRFKAL